MGRVRAVIGVWVWLLCSVWFVPAFGDTGAEDLRFDIDEVRVTGSTLLDGAEIDAVTGAFIGPGKTAEDVEKMRMAVEQRFREAGYPTVLVNIPEQSVEDGVVDLTVVEGRIRRVRITGNRYFTMGKIARDLPIFAPGEVLYLPEAKKQLHRANMNPDLKVKPVLIPGREPGTVDVELTVTDKLPLHGSLEVNNRASANTSDIRVNGVIHYDNLWQREHSFSIQCQTAPEETEEVMALSVSYLIHAPWNYRHLLASYGVLSDSRVAFGEGFSVKGKGVMVGVRYVMPLEGSETFTHNVTLGLDYKRFEDALSFGGEDAGVDVTPVSYVPLSFVYQAARLEGSSKTTATAGLTLVPRGVAMDVGEYENKRFKARGNPIVFKLGLEHAAGLPWGFGLNVRLDGQIADQPLVSNEQYSAGGMESVRGYLESESAGDNAGLVSVEWALPDLVRLFSKKEDDDNRPSRYKCRPYVFYDGVYQTIRNPLPGEDRSTDLQGAGVGVRGYLTRYLAYGFDWGQALSTNGETRAGDSRGYFRIKGTF